MTITSAELSKRTRATYRQIDYWCTIGLISPVGEASPGSGYYREFDEKIVNKVRFMAKVSKAFNHSFNRDMLKKIYVRYEEGSVDLGDGFVLSWKE